tara:strand:- start:16 stop:1464 length:1449 start_codon:yes stop_codon:yes gene_type:complete
MPYIGVSPQFGVRKKHTYTATAGQTSFSGAGSEGVTLSYTDSNFVDVYQNGVKLGDADYTSTSGTAIVLDQGASVDDLVEIIVFDAFSVADTVSKADGGTFDGNVTMAGTLGVTGNQTNSGNLTVSGAFTSQGIDDNADAVAITIDSSEKVAIGSTSVDSDASVMFLNGTDPSNIETGQLVLKGTATSGAADTGAGLTFKGHNGTGNRGFGSIQVLKENGTSGNNDSFMRFSTRDNTNGYAEHARILSNGALQVKVNTSGYTTWSGADTSSQVSSNITNEVTFTVNANVSSFASEVQRLLCNRTATSSYNFLVCTSGNLTDDEFKLRGDGNAYADGSWSGGGADYAEYFEWKDGNTDNEDRRGFTVVLDGDKIRKSTSEDDTKNIIGVISGNPSVVGDNAWNSWSNKYQKDDYGSYIRDENGDRILNKNFDDTQEYKTREDRQEWDIVGLMGKIRVRVGQPIGDRWIKMKEISDTIHEYLVR